MFFLARSALCIGLVVTMHPDESHDSLRDVAASVVGQAASSQGQSLFDQVEARPRRQLDLAARLDIGQLATALGGGDDPRVNRGKRRRGREVPAGILAMLNRAAAD